MRLKTHWRHSAAGAVVGALLSNFSVLTFVQHTERRLGIAMFVHFFTELFLRISYAHQLLSSYLTSFKRTFVYSLCVYCVKH